MSSIKLCPKAQKFHEEVLADIKLNEMNISEKTKECPAIKTKWLMIYLEEKKYLNLLEQSLTMTTEEYVRTFGKEGVPKIKTKMESESDDKVKKIRRGINEQKEVIEYLEGVMKIMYSFGFEIKNVISLLQLEK